MILREENENRDHTMEENVLNPIELKLIEGQVAEALRTCFDPEIPVNIYDLGLIYVVHIDDHNVVNVQMTLTAPACPVAGTLPGQVEKVLREVEGVRDASVELVWDPPWDQTRMSEEARLTLGLL